jgi:hypothetical protein
MGLPKITFIIATAGLALSVANIQKVPGLVITGNTVAGKITIGVSKQLFSLASAELAGITVADNPFAHKHVKAFYDFAGDGAELWLMLASDATTVTNIVDKTQNLAAKLLNDAAGKIRVLGVLKKSLGTEIATNGLDGDITTAVPNAQALAKEFADKYYPVRILLSGNNFSGDAQDLFDYSTSNFNKVAILLANTDAAKEASIGLALGKLASIPVQRNIGRVKDGPVESLNAYFTDSSKVTDLSSSWESIHGKGYIFLRNFAGISGFFFSDDPTLTSATDDFKSLTNGFVMDKLVLIAYATLINNLSDEIPVTESGTIHPAIIKSWQNEVENAVNNLMTANGELSGFKANIDPNQNVLGTNKLEVKLSPQPVGYAKEIDVYIGFTTQITN